MLICRLCEMSGLHKWTYRLSLYPVSPFSMLVIILLIIHVGQSKNKGSEQLACILALEKTVENHQCCVNQLENDLISDHVNDFVDYNLKLATAKASLSKATHVLRQKKSALGVSAHTDLHLLSNNKWLQTQTNAQALKIRIREQLCQRKFELERLEQSYRSTINGKQCSMSDYCF